MDNIEEIYVQNGILHIKYKNDKPGFACSRGNEFDKLITELNTLKGIMEEFKYEF